MGERKGVNKYYPPDYDPSKGGLNKFLGTHALRERARKRHLGILIIRFEMPYNIWCEGCNNHIGTGVRYNAEKKKVGMYYSTPIYQFRMKCHLCDNYFEIKTDPANLDYEIVSGARRQERRWDPTENEQVVPEDKDVSRKMATDAMYKLEHGVQDKDKSHELDPTIQRLEEFQSSRWHDDYTSNRKLRESMRTKRDEAKAQAVKDASYHLAVPLLPPSEEDEKVAKLMQFTQSKSSEKIREEKRALIDAQSVFAKLKPKRVSKETKKAVARQSLQDIITNSQKNISNFKNNLGPQGLGIVRKKQSSHDLPLRQDIQDCKSKVDDCISATLSRNESSVSEKTVKVTSSTGGPSDICDSLAIADSLSLKSEDCNEVEQFGVSENGFISHVNSSHERRGNVKVSSPKPQPGLSSECSSAFQGNSQTSPANASLGILVNYDLSGSDSDECMQ